jgi:hypothetical protein
MRQPKPRFRKQKQAWYVPINGQRLSLGKDKKEAWQKYYETMAGRRPIEESTATVTELLERYLDWFQENRKPGTYQKVKVPSFSIRGLHRPANQDCSVERRGLNRVGGGREYMELDHQ